jgi:hypothetical protein
MPKMLQFYPLLRFAVVDQLPVEMYSERTRDVMMAGVVVEDAEGHRADLAGIAPAWGEEPENRLRGHRGME